MFYMFSFRSSRGRMRISMKAAVSSPDRRPPGRRGRKTVEKRKQQWVWAQPFQCKKGTGSPCLSLYIFFMFSFRSSRCRMRISMKAAVSSPDRRPPGRRGRKTVEKRKQQWVWAQPIQCKKGTGFPVPFSICFICFLFVLREMRTLTLQSLPGRSYPSA